VNGGWLHGQFKAGDGDEKVVESRVIAVNRGLVGRIYGVEKLAQFEIALIIEPGFLTLRDNI
jgi:hypothetical protein